jgi:hypothetical protein
MFEHLEQIEDLVQLTKGGEFQSKRIQIKTGITLACLPVAGGISGGIGETDAESQNQPFPPPPPSPRPVNFQAPPPFKAPPGPPLPVNFQAPPEAGLINIGGTDAKSAKNLEPSAGLIGEPDAGSQNQPLAGLPVASRPMILICLIRGHVLRIGDRLCKKN